MRIRIQASVLFVCSVSTAPHVAGCRAPDRAEARVDAQAPDHSSELDVVEARLSTLLGSPPQVFGIDTYAAGSGDFRVGVLLLVADDANGCFENHHNPLLFGETFDTDVVSCALPELGPYATGTAELFDGKDWRLHVRAAASGGTPDEVATGYVNAQWRDVFTVVAAASAPDAPVPVFIRLRHRRDIQNPPFSFLRFELEVQREFGPTVHYQRDDYETAAESEFERDIAIGTFAPGTRLRVDAALDAVAESGGCCGKLADGTVVDPKEVDADVSVSLCSAVAGASLEGASGATGACGPAGDVRIVGVEPVQSVFGAPLIAGKDTVIAVDVESSFAAPIDVQIEVTVDTPLGPQSVTDVVSIPNGCSSPKRFYLPHPELAASPCDPSETAAGMLGEGLAPVSGEDYRVTVALVPPAPDEDPSNDLLASATFPVKTTGLRVGYAGVFCSGCSPSSIPDPQYAMAISASDTWTSAMYPLSPDGYVGERCLLGGIVGDCPILGDSTKHTGMLVDQDLAHAMVKRELPSAERVIAFVPAGYFPYHGRSANTGGLTVPGYGENKTSLVSAPKAANAIPVVPHEIAHQILPVGWNAGFDHYGFPAGAPPAIRPLGYFVGCCEILPDAQNLMEASLLTQPPHVWIDQPTYAAIMPAVLILPDPAILLITGRETRDGKIRVHAMDELPLGRPSPTTPGDHFIDLLDDRGTVLSTTSVSAPFKMITDDGTFDLDEQPITIELVYPLETARIRWRIVDRVLHEMDPVPQTLRTAVKGLPDRAFVKNPTERRTALLARVDAFGTMLEKRAFQGAVQKLRNDLRPRIEDWTVDYVRDDAGQTERSALLLLLDRVEARVQARASVQ